MITLKEILQEIQDRNFETPTEVYATNPAPKYRRLLTFANQAVRKIIMAHDWSLLKRQHTVNVVDGQELYPLPEDYYSLINQTTYRGSTYFPIDFVANSQSIAFRRNYDIGQVHTGRLYRGQLEFVNFPAGPVTLEYMSNGLVLHENGDSDLKFTADDDQFGADYSGLDELIVLGTLAIYLRAKQSDGLDVAIQDYASELKQQIYNDSGARYINNRGYDVPVKQAPFNPDYEI